MLPIITQLPLLQLASGDRLELQVYRFVGEHPGKKAYLQSNLHGDEVVGNVVLHRLIECLLSLEASQLVGEIWIVPACNPVGMNQRHHHFSTGRFSTYDGSNWNRIFWDYAKDAPEEIAEFARSHLHDPPEVIQTLYRQCIQERFNRLRDKINAPASVPFREKYRYLLQSLCINADYVIDLHTSSDTGLEFVYYFRDRHLNAPLFLLETAVLLDQYDGDAFDEAFIKPWLALEAQFAQLGRSLQFDIEAWTLELGMGTQIHAASVEKGFRGIQNYLMKKGMLAIEPPSVSVNTLLATNRQTQRYYAPTGGMIQNRLPLGTSVQAGELLYQILSFNKEENLPTLISVTAERSGCVFDISTNHAVNEGEYVLCLLTGV